MTANTKLERLEAWEIVPSTPAESSLAEPIGSGYRLRDATSNADYRLRWRDQDIDVPVGAEFSIGRASECLLKIASKMVSRHHARLRRDAQGLLIEDLKSMNGVMVNREKIVGPTLLRHGDVLNIGDELIEVLDMESVRHSARLSTATPEDPRAARTLSCDEIESEAPPPPTLAELTDDELDLLEKVVLGHSDREIALEMKLSMNALETMRARLCERIQCHTRGELVTYAICSGLMRGR